MPTLVFHIDVPVDFGEPGSANPVVMVTQNTIGGAESLSPEIVIRIQEKVLAALMPPPDVLNQPVQALKLGPRIVNPLRSGILLLVGERRPIETVGQLVELTADDLLGYVNFGPKKLEEIRKALDEHGLKLRGDDS